jgi:ABC-type cobalt transport system substrate-binding protein
MILILMAVVAGFLSLWMVVVLYREWHGADDAQADKIRQIVRHWD